MPELTEEMYCHQQICIPLTFPYLLRQFAKAAIRTQPNDLLKWSTAYFRCLSLNIPPPVKPRLEYPIPKDHHGLTPGWLRALLHQLQGNQTVSFKVLWDRWIGACLEHDDLIKILCLGGFDDPMAVPWLRFISLCAAHLADNLTQTMILICEILTEDPEGGSAMIPARIFVDLYTFLAHIDASKPQVLKNYYFRDSLLGLWQKRVQEEEGVADVVEEVSGEVESSQSTASAEEVERKRDDVSAISCPSIKSDVKPMSQEELKSDATQDEEESRETFKSGEEEEERKRLAELKKSEEEGEAASSLLQKSVEYEEDVTKTEEGGGPVAEKTDGDEEHEKKPVERETFELKVIQDDDDEPKQEESAEEGEVEEKADHKEDAVPEDTEDVQTPAGRSSLEEAPPTAEAAIQGEGEDAERKVQEKIDDKKQEGQKQDEKTVRGDKAIKEDIDRLKALHMELHGEDDDELEKFKQAIMAEFDETDSQIIAPAHYTTKIVMPGDEVFGPGDKKASSVSDYSSSVKVQPTDYEDVFVGVIPGIGPIVPKEIFKAVLEYVDSISKEQHDMIMPRNIRHYDCPPLEVWKE